MSCVWSCHLYKLELLRSNGAVENHSLLIATKARNQVCAGLSHLFSIPFGDSLDFGVGPGQGSGAPSTADLPKRQVISSACKRTENNEVGIYPPVSNDSVRIGGQSDAPFNYGAFAIENRSSRSQRVAERRI
jgi:hypothetical protein